MSSLLIYNVENSKNKEKPLTGNVYKQNVYSVYEHTTHYLQTRYSITRFEIMDSSQLLVLLDLVVWLSQNVYVCRCITSVKHQVIAYCYLLDYHAFQENINMVHSAISQFYIVAMLPQNYAFCVFNKIYCIFMNHPLSLNGFKYYCIK